MIDGLSHLMTIRRSGHRPHSVMLTIDGPYIKPKYQNELQAMELVAYDSVARDDFRAFQSLSVTLYAGTWSKLAADAFEKLKGHAIEIYALCPEYGEDIGFVWSRKYGLVDFNDYRWIIQFHKARNSICRSNEEVKERVRLENEALKNLPDLESYRGDDFL